LGLPRIDSIGGPVRVPAFFQSIAHKEYGTWRLFVQRPPKVIPFLFFLLLFAPSAGIAQSKRTLSNKA
jgi:hypothetical protein